MPARRKATPSYLLHSQSGKARAVWSDPAGGRHFRMLPGPHDSKESREAFARLLLELEAERLADAPLPSVVTPHSDAPDGAFRLFISGDCIFRVPARVDSEELARRRWLTRPDLEWHTRRMKELTTEGNTYGVQLHRAFEARAKALVAIDAGDYDAAQTLLIEAALLRPRAPSRLPLAPPPRAAGH